MAQNHGKQLQILSVLSPQALNQRVLMMRNDAVEDEDLGYRNNSHMHPAPVEHHLKSTLFIVKSCVQAAVPKTLNPRRSSMQRYLLIPQDSAW